MHDDLIKRELQRRHDAIEAACEQMLVDGTDRGVLVETWPFGWAVSLSHEVQWGTVGWKQTGSDRPSSR